MTFVDYINPEKVDYNGSCCDQSPLCSDCDTYFEICLQTTNPPVASMKNCDIYVKTKVHENDKFKFSVAFGGQFGSKGERNPLVYHFGDSWEVY